jgi:hypothetical protein
VNGQGPRQIKIFFHPILVLFTGRKSAVTAMHQIKYPSDPWSGLEEGMVKKKAIGLLVIHTLSYTLSYTHSHTHTLQGGVVWQRA